MKVPFFSLEKQTASLRSELMSAIGGVIDSQGFANGPATRAFEEQLAAYLGVKHVVALNSGTSALHAALLCVGVQPGDEVITVAHTWISTCWAISYVGARPVFVDVDERTFGLDPAQVEARITPRTRAILPVHLHGHPVDLEPLLEIGARRGIPVIEDTAQSIGSTYKGRQTGSFGIINATSFYPSKNLGAAGEGGAVMTDDAELAARARKLRDHAQLRRHVHDEIGFNWRMDGVQGAVLSVKLRHLDAWNERRRVLAERYFRGLEGVPGLRLQREQPWARCNWHVFPAYHAQRDEVRTRLETRGIQTGIHYPTPVHLQPAYASVGMSVGALPVSERLASTELSLPMFPEMTDQEADATIEALRTVCTELVAR